MGLVGLLIIWSLPRWLASQVEHTSRKLIKVNLPDKVGHSLIYSVCGLAKLVHKLDITNRTCALADRLFKLIMFSR